MSNLKKNIIANYTCQIYVIVVGVILLPTYIKYMGSEAYGLVGFFAMLQAWFKILDLGLTPTIGRETARYYGGAISNIAFRRIHRSLTIIFITIATIGGAILFCLSDFIAYKWFNLNGLTELEVVVAVKIMAISVALRWMTGLYRGVIMGAEQLIWLSGFNAIIATLRFVGVLISMRCFGFTPFVFFIHQLIIAIIENIGLLLKSYQLLPSKKSLDKKIGWSLQPVKSVLKFSLTIAFTGLVWVFVTQTDKLILSGILSLENYGYFTLSVLVANGVILISSPIGSAIMPRLARLYAENKHSELLLLYKKTTQLMIVIAGSAAITLIVAAEPLLFAWTGDIDLTKKASTILRLYAAGNLFLSMSALVYYMQYAKGNLRFHLIGNFILFVLLIPSVVYLSNSFGGIGAGYAWLGANFLYFFFWVAFVHYKIEPGLHVNWMKFDVLKILLPMLFVFIFMFFDFELLNRMKSLLYVTFISGTLLIIALSFSSLFTFNKNAGG
ncbi:polysaccharide biosynthesis protein [Vibrio tasmaniensis]|nr:polysaccharide biosynthesis protein [Vibrio tasmaniensis]